MIASKFHKRSLIAFIHDFIAVIAAWWLAYLFRFNFEIPPDFQLSFQENLFWIAPTQAAIFYSFGLYHGLWRYASLPDLKRIVLAVVLGAVIVPFVIYMLKLPILVPRAVIFLAPLLLLLIMGGSRVLYRSWKERRFYNLKNSEHKSVIVLGTGSTAINLVKDLIRSPDWQVVGLLGDNPKKLGTRLHGVRVLGMIDELPVWVEKLGVSHVIIAMPAASQSVRRQALEMCTHLGIKALTIPSYADLVSGKMTVSQIRDIELDDLLGRAPVVLDTEGLHDLLTGKIVLITGAGGSIGSELCRQIMAFNPGQLVLLEVNELALYTVQEEFLAKFPAIAMAFVIGDIKDQARLQQVFARYQPTVVFHAAAYKHVPLMEIDNAWQAVLNNVYGTYQLAKVAIEYRVEKFVLISTDKAVNPTNVMGASKRLAEMVCQALQQSVLHAENNGTTPAKTCFVIVRFGNVLGSTGSVIPKFREQITKGGPITVTHPEISRYFMSIQEAAQLVLQAGLMGGVKGGGEIFVMDMGDPVKIVDLAKDMIRLSGLSEEDIKIVYTGLRPGEKLHEELATENESTVPTQHEKLRITLSDQVNEQWLDSLVDWFATQRVLNDDEVKSALAKWVPEYSDRKVDEQSALTEQKVEITG
ncbi:FlaA1/EpsC-like NDP-sugar epimerase [Nitrosomonas nitrosa]|jgi:FlaA1/EpsC-like NDP-sugar epimerase|uniref:Capsular polysaccharide biosynthesis protein CapD n=1 Tax=Nitrosomonas nitrosa TaxID=52442 RepID=A0A1I4LJM8_9PROT|nr:nucleoside-diphosphate sugar epimerase/dehydratase [Nitrosomonas nitrosa]MCO6433742.1 polysaccharide biosynthesis protein [Nitrosomonas nitrosa]PTR04915.1 FlaA1/EpsC-like NDP-sugar epimerase [Nitrosomonas nitrosa]CAE6485931.1 Capsular polysaccharide biosynthesis protein CapD [Nitrosomonas nitrosa]SFL91160.1 NDP-sugar epimerase, includes UDP-GlcNAc-inverting 4,6-dehydratase FlaA1 and capsular polysaccharide biosynthesis protein EpsC [Nitrosomonas nitrosa]